MAVMDEPSQSLSRSERVQSTAILAAFLLMIGYLVVSHAYPNAAVIGCPFRALSGLSCFGCGMTRSTAHFLHGDLLAAFQYHPFGPVFLLGFAATALHHGAQLVRGRPLDYAALRLWRRIERPVWVGALVFLGLFGAARLAGELTGILTPI